MTVEEILRKMTLKEKVALCSGKDFGHTKEYPVYGIGSASMADGPHGLRVQREGAEMLGVNDSVPSTSFPTAVSTGCSWDVKLLGEIGEALSLEAAANQISIFLGPGVCIKRNPLCGRNFEYFSEDPYLAGKLSGSYIKSAQKKGIGTSLKHFACNNQEYKRFSSDSVLDERTMREIYLTGFEIAVKEGQPATVMSSYNKVNGIHSGEHKELLTEILREDWGFEGAVITDWGAMSDRIEAFKAGCDLLMPGGSEYMEKKVLRAVKDGGLSEKDIDQCAKRVIKLALQSEKALKGEHSYSAERHHELARRAAEQSAVLLQNRDNILPLSSEQKVAVIGHMAKEPRYQGSGSSHINPNKLVSLCDVMTEAVYAEGTDKKGDTNDQLIAAAIAAAKEVDVAVLCVGLTDAYESEGFDRDNMKMPKGHLRLIDEVVKANPNTVVVLSCGSVVETPWAESVKAILYMGLPGQAGGEAIKNLLYGKVNPSGRLAETWPVVYEDCPSASYYSNGKKDAHYREGIYVGYRYYDKAGVKVRWPFGFGLSYTTFEYSNISLNGDQVKVTVTNTGRMSGSEVVQLYIAPPQNGIHRPTKELKRFDKLYLNPGESKEVAFTLDERCFAIWNQGWKVQAGEYRILLGGNPQQIRQTVTVTRQGDNISIPSWQPGSWYETPKGIPTKSQWEQMLGHLVTEKPLKKGDFTMDNTVLEMKDYSLIMKIMFYFIEKTIAKSFGGKKDYNNPTFRVLISTSTDCSLSGLQINGSMKDGAMQGLLEMANGHYIRGIRRMIKGE